MRLTCLFKPGDETVWAVMWNNVKLGIFPISGENLATFKATI